MIYLKYHKKQIDTKKGNRANIPLVSQAKGYKLPHLTAIALAIVSLFVSPLYNIENVLNKTNLKFNVIIMAY